MPKVQHTHILIVALALHVVGCMLLQGISYYDPTTYKNLTDLKPEVVMLYESFGEDAINDNWIRSIRLRLAQMYEYEKGKGEKNKQTTEQVKKIKDAFEDDVQARLNSSKWTQDNIDNSVENISDAFDTAIATERKKNKNE